MATSRPELAGHGVAVPLSTRPAVERVLLRPLGWRPGSGFVGPRAPDPLARLVRCLRAVAQHDALISSEDLAELDGPTARSVVALARSEGFEVQLIVTARAWTRQLPSEYQQFLKHRLADTFPDFLDSVRAGEGFYGRHFRLRQDLAQVCARWAADVPPQNMHVVVLPRRGEDRDFIFTEVAAILGVPASVLPPHHRDVNALLRRSRGRGLPSLERRAGPPAPRPHPTHLRPCPARAQPRCPETRCESADRAAPRPPLLGQCRVDASRHRTRGEGVLHPRRPGVAPGRRAGHRIRAGDQRRGPVSGRHRDARALRGAHRAVRAPEQQRTTETTAPRPGGGSCSRHGSVGHDPEGRLPTETGASHEALGTGRLGTSRTNGP